VQRLGSRGEGAVSIGAQQIGNRIERRMKELGLSQKELAERTGISAPAISRYIANERPNPGAHELAAIARALDVTLSWLYDESGPKRLTSGDPELTTFEWPGETPEVIRIAVMRRVLHERDAHRSALITYWHQRMREIIDEEEAKLVPHRIPIDM
jgi:transcriptional regulator with XRE-family HTH domain